MPDRAVVYACAACLLISGTGRAEPADVVLYHGKIVTVDPAFRIAEAMAIQGERILEVGASDEVLKLAGPGTKRIDLGGKTVLPGLNDTHSHPIDAALHEFDHRIPEMESVADVLDYIGHRAEVLEDGQWIVVQQVFITRLRDRRFPTREELDRVAPKNPVIFRTGPDASVNSLALALSGIDEDFQITDGQPGSLERDPKTGKLTGILRSSARLIKAQPVGKAPSDEDRRRCLRALLAAYNEVGITSVNDRETTDSSVELYAKLRDNGELTCRMFLTYYVDTNPPLDEIEAAILRASRHPLRRYDNLLWLRGIKVYLDGGMLTGSAYMRKPWGVSKIYSISDPAYRGMLFIEPDKLHRIARCSLANHMQLTAHAVGDAAIDALVAAYERVNREFSVRDERPCISHSNFMSPEAIGKMAELGIVADLQPAWIWLDGSTLVKQFGDERLAYFQPYKTLFERGVMVAGGSDHMQKLGRRRSLNTYDPFLGIWTTLVRQPRWTDRPLHPEQAIAREQAIRFYTIQGAYLTFEEKEKGSLEKGKLADFIVLDKDILICPVDEVKDINVLGTWLGGKQVYARTEAP
ncbi:MAG: amidohydrolase [Pirellulales bacterium]|nr:amidohydrolase [Pirellulales bacterium]